MILRHINPRTFIIFQLPDVASHKSDMHHYYVPERRSVKRFLIAAIIYSHLTRLGFSVRMILSTRELRGTVYIYCMYMGQKFNDDRHDATAMASLFREEHSPLAT